MNWSKRAKALSSRRRLRARRWGGLHAEVVAGAVFRGRAEVLVGVGDMDVAAAARAEDNRAR